MKPSVAFSVGLLGVALVSSALVKAPEAAPQSLAHLVPVGPLLLLESKDFASLVRDWNESSEKRLWLKSDTYQVFSRSRLYLRLSEAQDEFAAAAGFPPDMSLIESVAGGESALALYDIGKLEFLYFTRMPSAQTVENELWRSRGDYEPRNAAGIPYFVRVDPASRRFVAFATTNDYLLLATREDLLAGALALVAGRRGPSVRDERWFTEAVRAAGSRGDLRLVINLQAVARSPHFRSYWIQRNVSEVRQYVAEVSDVHRSAGEIREERVILRLEPLPASGAIKDARGEEVAASPEGGTAVAELMRLVPDDSGLYRAWAMPKSSQALDLLERKVLAPRSGPPEPARVAPRVWLSSGEVGSEADLETRIDEAPLEKGSGAFASEPLRRLLEGAKLEAMLQLQSSRALADGVFVGNQSAIVLLGASDWDADAARGALMNAIESLWTTSRLGTNWVERIKGPHTYHELDGLAGVAMAAHGRNLVVANAAEALVAVLDRLSIPRTSQVAVYAAGFRHARERGQFSRMMRLIDHPSVQTSAGDDESDAGEPRFFSENIASLSRTLARVEAATIVVREEGPVVSETVIYRLTP